MNHFAKSLIIVATVLLVVSCGTIKTLEDVPPYVHTSDKPIYPAVCHAIVSGHNSYWGNGVVAVPDPNTVVVEHVRVSDGIKLSDFTLRISLVNNVVTYQFSNIRQRLPTGSNSDWTRVERFTQADRELIFTSWFNTEIPKVMGDEALYARAKEAADRRLGGAPGGSAPGGGALSYSLPLQNPQNYLLYPAVGAAFTNLKGSLLGANTASLGGIDALGNQFTIENCVAERSERRMRDLITYQIKIAYRDNQLTIEFTDIEPIGATIMLYSNAELDAIPLFDTQKTADQLKTQIERALASAAAYGEAKKAFLANNAFLSRAFRPITGMLREEFATALFKDGDIGLSARISDVRQNTNAEFRNYTTEIRATLYRDETTPSLSSSFASVYLYTSDTSLARLRQGENILLSGRFVRIDYSSTTPLFIMTK